MFEVLPTIVGKGCTLAFLQHSQQHGGTQTGPGIASALAWCVLDWDSRPVATTLKSQVVLLPVVCSGVGPWGRHLDNRTQAPSLQIPPSQDRQMSSLACRCILALSFFHVHARAKTPDASHPDYNLSQIRVATQPYFSNPDTHHSPYFSHTIPY